LSRLIAGVRVCWTLKDGTHGEGITVGDEDSSGRILVAVDPLQPDPNRRLAQASLEFHPVIYCTVTWLTII